MARVGRHYTVQHHLCSLILAPIESRNATSYIVFYPAPFSRYRTVLAKLSTLTVGASR